jgi:hypothetical protein
LEVPKNFEKRDMSGLEIAFVVIEAKEEADVHGAGGQDCPPYGYSVC